jgi:NitT/TauT family transport system ATP-binding protein
MTQFDPRKIGLEPLCAAENSPKQYHIELENLGWISPSGKKILDGINLKLKRGEFVTLVGPSGSGKSTLLKLISGQIRPTSGRISVNSTIANNFRQKFGFVFQDATLMPWANLYQNIRLPLDLKKVPRVIANRKIQEVLDFVGLDAVSGLYPHEMSGGMKMRASIARALVTDPECLLMDEPFAALDEPRRTLFDEEVRKFAKEKDISVIFVTHSIYEAAFLSDRIMMMAADPGRFVETIFTDGPDFRRRDYQLTSSFFNTCKAIQNCFERFDPVG